MRKTLTVILAHADVAKQQSHLRKGALFLPEPEPPPEPFADIVLRVEIFSGEGVDLEARILQILEGRGIAVTFDDLASAKEKLAPIFAAAEPGEDEATFVFWGRGEKARKASMAPRKKTSAPPARRSTRPARKSLSPAAKKPSKGPAVDPFPASAEVWGDTLPKIPLTKPANVRPATGRVVVVRKSRASKPAPPENIAMDTLKDPPRDPEES